MTLTLKALLRSRLGLLAAALAGLAWIPGGEAAAQDPSRPAAFGEVRLQAGFLPDPVQVNLTAGGQIRTTLGGVQTSVADAPDFKLYYQAGSLPLTLHVQAGADTTLLVNLPDGSWVANDDGAGNLNPMLHFPFPQSGRYDIWVGTFNGGTAPARLFIPERQ